MPSLQQLLVQLPDWQENIPKGTQKVMSLITRCHTPQMGYHLYQCEDKDCKHHHVQYHGCRNRHCPHCGSHKAQQWMEDRLKELLPVKYFHVVFTLPSELKSIALGNRTEVFKLLFDSASHCLLTLSNDPKYLGATPSISAVLHTWGQQLDFHPHIHCIVSGGGVDKQNRWKNLKKGDGKYLFPYKVMERLYKGYFLQQLNELILQKKVKIPENCDWYNLKDKLHKKKWIVYAKNPMGNAAQVVEYLGRYTQKIAISNHRIKNIDAQNRVTFWYKDYRDAGKRKLMILEGNEFLRRFTQHILPYRFVRIRHYGILGNYKRKERVSAILRSLKVPIHAEKVTIPSSIQQLCTFGKTSNLCPVCKESKMILIGICLPIKPRAGPLKPNLNFLKN